MDIWIAAGFAIDDQNCDEIQWSVSGEHFKFDQRWLLFILEIPLIVGS